MSDSIKLASSATPAADGSGTIASAATAQTLFGGAIPENGYAIYNPGTADLWISDSATAAINGAGSIRIAGNGGGYETPLGYRAGAPLSIIGATAGAPFTARKW